MTEEFVFQISPFSNDGEPPVKWRYVVSSNVFDLIYQGQSAFGLEKCVLVSADDVEIDSDAVLRGLAKSGSNRVFLKAAITTRNIELNASEMGVIDETLPIPLIQDRRESVGTCTDQVEYDVPSIIRQMKVGRKCIDPEAVISRLNASIYSCLDEDMKFIRKATGRWLMARACKLNYPTQNEYEAMAKSIYHYFPITGSSVLSPPWSLWFEPKTFRGSLERYVRNRRWESGLKKPSESSRNRKSTPITYDAAKAEASRKTMYRTPLTQENKADQLKLFVETREARQKAISDRNVSDALILKQWIRLVDFPEAVADELMFFYSVSLKTFEDNWEKVEDHILDHAQATLKTELGKNTCEEARNAITESDRYKHVQALMKVLLHLLPNKNANATKSGKTVESFDLLIQTFEGGTSVESAMQKAESRMRKPGILLIGRQFYIKIEDVVIPLPSVTSFVTAVGHLMSYYFVLRCKYPLPLHNVLAFFEHIFCFKQVSASQPAKRLWAVVGKGLIDRL